MFLAVRIRNINAWLFPPSSSPTSQWLRSVPLHVAVVIVWDVLCSFERHLGRNTEHTWRCRASSGLRQSGVRCGTSVHRRVNTTLIPIFEGNHQKHLATASATLLHSNTDEVETTFCRTHGVGIVGLHDGNLAIRSNCFTHALKGKPLSI